jgi:RNA polymerase sigma-54 factor
MKPSLQLKLSQHLALTPQLQQSIKLLQLSTIELNQEIEKVLLENPMIERDEPENQLGSSRVEAPARWRRPAARPPRSASRSRPGNPTGNGSPSATSSPTARWASGRAPAAAPGR